MPKARPYVVEVWSFAVLGSVKQSEPPVIIEDSCSGTAAQISIAAVSSFGP